MSAKTVVRALSPDDRGRICCQSHRWHPDCQELADVCHEVLWNTGNTEGTSFFYYCTEGSKLLLERSNER
jgi:hypothetical protein